ncbi:unknown (plasmid) [Halobacterium salinarum NRC-1]|uniref:Spurious ORF n=1 Tax=Halobacterium salinarum (strain ATCC 700922 / JCM 11081 / NRC-1) TaxID=64091 RepID=O54549_HALSA|nr:unknown [Halobacterium salinarum NRC-1]AAC82943.1 unknown [Halobacterium salinarum NRC-1]DAC79528.1 TPA_inf: spurious ORF [Halobacterium salinarum NRC-1]DAC79657.1 TPA_inf: spurious ORF [Halobacterium salinarum NRC-1]
MGLLHPNVHYCTRRKHQARSQVKRGCCIHELHRESNQDRADSVAGITPHPVDAHPRRPPSRVSCVARNRHQVRVQQRHPEPGDPSQDGPREVAIDEHHPEDARAREEHPGNDGRTAADAVREPPGRNLEEVHRTVDTDDDPNRRDTEALTRQVQRDGNPEQCIDEVLYVAGLRRREQRPVAVRRALQHLVERQIRVVVVVVTLGLGVLDGLLNQEDGDEERQYDDHGEEVERFGPQTPLACDDTRDPGADSDASVAERLVDADREPALVGTREVDLRVDRHTPRQRLVDPQQDVPDRDPAPARGEDEDDRQRERRRPSGDEDGFATVRLAPLAGVEIEDRLHDPERDDERADHKERLDAEDVLPEYGDDCPFGTDGQAGREDEQDVQRELPEVFADPLAEFSGRTHGLLGRTVVWA